MLGHPTHNRRLIEAILNHPDVRPTIDREAEGRLPADIVLRDDVVCYAGMAGLFVFAHRGGGEWQAHVATLPGARGVQSVKLGREAFEYLFGELGARRCHAAAPIDLPHVAVFAKTLGFKRARLDPEGGFELLVKETA